MPTTIDLRSDTVTLPPDAMRRAMYEAELGDDVYGEDPTVNCLEERTSALLGMEAALFVPTGTMGNLVAALTHCGRGDEIIMGDEAHMFHYEAGGSSVLGGLAMRTVTTDPRGALPLGDLSGAIRHGDDIHAARTALICLENTHNRRGGMVLGHDYMNGVRALADAAGVPVHLDGARIFNAATFLNVPVADLVRHVDTVSLCFSKGLAAPAGSILCGPRPFIDRALRWRKMLGGGMRQVGVLAAAALYALDHMTARLDEDHANARALAEGLVSMQGLRLAQPEVQTNIVLVDTSATGVAAPEWLSRLKSRGVLAGQTGTTLVRFVTHYGIARADVDDALARIHGTLS